ncbi:hypothetical protein [Paraburkholderia sediminicola]|uniref:hypothetical protein n=1 Tax=Paraburkholderia sediminicola TaxID=458836 RepID=UPI0038B786DF
MTASKLSSGNVWRLPGSSSQVDKPDYRLYDIQRAVLPTKLPLPEFHRELVRTQQVPNRKHLVRHPLRGAASEAAHLVMRAQTNSVRTLARHPPRNRRRVSCAMSQPKLFP